MKTGFLFIFSAAMATAGVSLVSPGCDSRPPHGTAASGPSRTVSVGAFKLGRPDLVLLITGGTNGQLEMCNCAGPMAGGATKRSGLFKSYRAAFPNAFTLDSGDAAILDSIDADKNDFIFQAFQRMGYDALTIGDQELYLGYERLKKRLEPGTTEYLSSTVTTAEGLEKLPLTPLVVRKFDGVKLAVVSDLRKDWIMGFPDGRKKQFEFGPIEPLARKVGELKSQGYTVVAVCHGNNDALEKTAADLKPDLLVRGNTAKTEEQLLDVGGIPAVKVGSFEYVGVVALKLGGDGRIKQIEYRPEVVDDRWPADDRLMEIYQAYAHAAMRRALDAERKTGLDYKPSNYCGGCHTAQYANWLKTRHSGAYNTLVVKNRTGDPNCIMCHTSGFGTEKGFYTFEKTPAMANVNCQNCHRFNFDEHQKAGFDFKKYKANKNVCTSCHTPITDPKFEEQFETKLPKVRCPKWPR
ncbi:MAG: hypothetical protein HZA50_03140 [Planctomycetes bacterium]|nr:hypothetical protein [Planctomycetota bacterium]